MPPTHDKLAYLVVTHGQFQLLKQLLSLLDDVRNDIFIHIDAKVKEPPFEELASVVKHSSLHFLSDRVDVRWGTGSQSLTELKLYAEAYAAGPYKYYCLISGACLPLKSQDAIHRFLNEEAHRGKNFLEVKLTDSPYMYQRLSRYHFEGRNPLTRLMKHMFRKLPFIDRIKGRFPIFVMGQNWSCLTHEAVHYLMEKRKELRKLLSHTVCSDELYRQLYFMNHPHFRETIYRNAEGKTPNLWLVDWSAGDIHPTVFTMEDLPRLKETDCLFGRKFSEAHMDAVEAVAAYVRSSDGQMGG